MPSDSVQVSAPAKINLHLGVHAEKDARGYHRVDSVMTAISLADRVTIAPAEHLTVELLPAADFPMEQNTAYRAAVALGEEFGRTPAYSIRIEKHIPLRAGLGGPSTDAAAALRGICHLWGIDPTDPRVADVARGIGADVPFFLYGPPAYFAGAGDVMEEVYGPLPELPIALVKPRHAGVTAAEAYRLFDVSPQELPPLEPMRAALRAGDEDAVLANIANNLAPAACEVAPAISEVLAWMREQPGVRVAEVSGSGSASFAICESGAHVRALVEAASARSDWWAHEAHVEKSGPVVSLL